MYWDFITFNLLIKPKSISPSVDFRHTFTVILPSVTQTLDNLNLLLTHFPSDHFLYNFTLDNSNHAYQDMTNEQKCSPKH